eukprot:scaffold3143_cov164-Amphora_coffeaeformis.AAC.2
MPHPGLGSVLPFLSVTQMQTMQSLLITVQHVAVEENAWLYIVDQVLHLPDPVVKTHRSCYYL